MPMHHLLVFVILSTLAASAMSAPGITGSIQYGGGKVFVTDVHRPKLIAELSVPGGQPFLVFSGFDCDDCGININIFIRDAAGGPIERPETDTRHVYPGTYRTYDSDELVRKVRAFVGRCTPSDSPGVVWFVDTKFEDGTWRKGTYLAQVEEGKLALRPEPGPGITLSAAIAAVSKRVCREIAGKKLTTEP
jgi:hypothetical protein